METFGLDIGSNSIKVIKLLAEGDKFKLQAYGLASTPAKSFLSERESDLILLAETIKKLVKDAKINTPNCVSSLPESQVMTTVIKLPVMSPSDLSEAIKWEAEQRVPQPLNEVRLAWDIISQPPKNDPVGKMNVLLVAAPLLLIDRYLKILTLADLKPVSLETEILGILRALKSEYLTEPAILVNLGASSTQLGIIEDGNLTFTHSISVGGTVLARAVSSELGLEINQAEEYKKSYGLEESKFEGRIKEVIGPVFETVISEIKKALSFYNEKHTESFINKAILTGGTSRLPGLVSYLASELSIEVVVGNPWNNLILDPQIAKEVKDEGYLYACAVGLAMKEIG